MVNIPTAGGVGEGWGSCCSGDAIVVSVPARTPDVVGSVSAREHIPGLLLIILICDSTVNHKA